MSFQRGDGLCKLDTKSQAGKSHLADTEAELPCGGLRASDTKFKDKLQTRGKRAPSMKGLHVNSFKNLIWKR